MDPTSNVFSHPGSKCVCGTRITSTDSARTNEFETDKNRKEHPTNTTRRHDTNRMLFPYATRPHKPQRKNTRDQHTTAANSRNTHNGRKSKPGRDSRHVERTFLFWQSRTNCNKLSFVNMRVFVCLGTCISVHQQVRLPSLLSSV